MRAGLQQSGINLLIAVILFSLLSACAETPARWDPLAYTVRQGDTLYSIAWRYEKDFSEIAEWNNISAPYAIYPGQRLVMQAANQDGTVSDIERPQVLVESSTGKVVAEEVVTEPVPITEQKKTHTVVKKNDTLYAIARREGYSHHQIARWNHLKAPYLLKPGQKLRLSPSRNALGQTASVQQSTRPVVRSLSQNKISAKPLTPAVKATATAAEILPTRVSRWNWPVKGRVVKTYKSGDTSRKGIGISGRYGQGVKAAAAGTVVYSGNGLINYGNLVIIKHSHAFLSAYAYNKSLLVKEGDSVKPGQLIAKMGKVDSGKPQLHFEIRRNGKPVNPLHYLPRS